METLRDRLARRVRKLMDTTLGLDTQTKVANKSGVSQSTVQRILARDQAATVDVLEQLAGAFGVARAQYFLLEPDEIDLLSAWNRLSAQDKDRVLGFLHVSSAQEPAHNPLLSFTSSKEAPPHLQAAIRRESAQPIAVAGAKSKQKHDEQQSPPKKRRRS